MFAHQRRRYDVKFLQRHDPINRSVSSQKGEEIDEQRRSGVVWNGDQIVKTLARPVFIQHLLLRNKDHLTAARLTFADEIDAFEIGRQTDDIERAIRRFEHFAHYSLFSGLRSPVKVCREIVSPVTLPKTKMIFKGPYPDIHIPETALSPFVLHRAVELADKAALIDGPTGRTITYAQFAAAVAIVAHNLAQRGFKKGEVLGILSPNCPEYGIAFHAVATLGGIVSPINPLYTRYEIAHQLKDSGARFLIATPMCIDRAREAAYDAGVEEAVVFREAGGAPPFGGLLVENGRATQVE